MEIGRFSRHISSLGAQRDPIHRVMICALKGAFLTAESNLGFEASKGFGLGLLGLQVDNLVEYQLAPAFTSAGSFLSSDPDKSAAANPPGALP